MLTEYQDFAPKAERGRADDLLALRTAWAEGELGAIADSGTWQA